jgi:hypothetical protein
VGPRVGLDPVEKRIRTVLIICTACFNLLKLCILSTEYICIGTGSLSSYGYPSIVKSVTSGNFYRAVA